MARQILTGVADIEKLLSGLSDKAGDKIARSALGAGLGLVAKKIKKAAPVGKTKALRNSIGKRFEKQKRPQWFQAKAGVNVGKQKKTAEGFKGHLKAPHAHLVALGTRYRERDKIGGRFSYIKNPTKTQLTTGEMPSNPFLKQAYMSAKAEASERMKIKAKERLAKELAKAKK
jgi:hypothetical protein